MQTIQQQLLAQMRAQADNEKPPTSVANASNASFAENWESDPFEDAPETLAPILSAAQIEWFSVLSRLGIAFPNSRFAAMGRDEIIENARVWALELRAVPAEAVRELYDRTMATWTSDFAPHTANFRARWLDPAWDFYADANANPNAKAPVRGMLPEPLPSENGPGATSARRNFAILRARGAFVCCECQNPFGIAQTAILGHSGAFWECADSACGFRCPVEDEMRAPIPVRAPLRKLPVETEKAPRTAAENSWLHGFLKACELDAGRLSAQEFAAFTAWAKWFKSKYECPPNFDLMSQTWPQWQQEVEDVSNN